MNQDAVVEDVKQFTVLKDQITQLTERQTIIKKRLTETIDEFGVEVIRGEINTILVDLRPKMYQQRHYCDLKLIAQFLRQITGAIGHNLHRH